MAATQQPDPFGSDAAYISGPPGPRAGFWKRLGASFVDGFILGIPFIIIWAAISFGVAIIGAITYYAILEGGPSGETLGKKALGIRVVDARYGGPIGYGRAVIRWFGRVVSCFFVVGILWMLWDRNRQTWHDKLARSVVVEPLDDYAATPRAP